MNRRDTLKAAVGGLLGLLLPHCWPTKRVQVFSPDASERVARAIHTKEMAKAKWLFVRLEFTLKSEGAVSATVLGDGGQVVSVYGGLLSDTTIPSGQVAIAALCRGRWEIIGTAVD